MALSHVTTHKHLLAIVNGIIAENAQDTFRILDIGCGDGKLMALLFVQLRQKHPDATFEIYGFDVGDHGVQSEGFINRAVEYLNTEATGPDWEQRVKTISTGDPWPYEDGFFDLSVSNQVLEHVGDPGAFISEAARTLAEGGVSVHVFPLVHVVVEPHLFIPVVHRFGSHDSIYNWIRFSSRIGLGKFRNHRKRFGVTLNDFSKKHADYIHYYTNYMSWPEALRHAKKAGVRASFRHTSRLYGLKWGRLIRRKDPMSYRPVPDGKLASMIGWLARFLSSVTLYLEKEETYTSR